jgi:NADH-quinone oxidoreductase subunit H
MYFTFHPIITIVLIAVAMGTILGTVAYLTLLERKIAAWVQDRIGPNRVGPRGLLQPIADGLKFLLKEDVIPSHVDKLFYLLAPTIALTTALLAFAVVPFGRTQAPPERPWPEDTAQRQEADRDDPEFAERVKAYEETTQFLIAPHVDIGFVFIFAVGSLATYGVILGGWSSNNKYSLMGSLRSSAQLISYEIPMGLSALGAVILCGSLNLERIIEHQAAVAGWNILFQPLAFLLFLTSIYAECNRMPFDLAEAEQELVGGYHTEYSAMKFALFFLAEYTHLITTSFLTAVLFLGGWHLPGIADPGSGGWVIKLIILAVKMALFIVLSMLIRWTIPRFRFDQLMGMAWKVMIPLSLVNIVCVMIIKQLHGSPWLLLPISVVLLLGAAVPALRGPRPPAPRSAPAHLAVKEGVAS